MRSLPPPCRWIDCETKSCLMWHYGCIAVVHADGRVTIQWARGKQMERRAASLAQGKRHVERWVAARPGLPPGKRAMAMRERNRARAAGLSADPLAGLARLDSPRIPHDVRR